MRSPLQFFLLGLALAALSSCGNDVDPAPRADVLQAAPGPESQSPPQPESLLLTTALPSRTDGNASTLFTKLPPAQTGITFQNTIDLSHPRKYLYQSGFGCGGVALGDLDGDGLPEIFLASGPGKNRLYRQRAPFQFEDVTATAGVGGGDAWAAGAAMVDIDGDGDLDLYVCHYDSPNALYLNESAFQFREAAKDYGLDIQDASLMPSFCDYDSDGDLDCLILTNRLYRPEGRPATPPVEKDANGKPRVKEAFTKYYGLVQTDASRFTMDDIGRPNYLLRNDGDRFTDVSSVAGIADHGFGLSATWWDYNEDGHPDLYVCNDFLDPDKLYQNNGDGTFTNVIEDTVNITPWFSMGSDANDLNNDGRLDLVVLDMAATTHYKAKIAMGEMGSMRWQIENIKPRQLMRNVCYLNTGTSHFIETAPMAGLASTDWSWAAKLADYDNDGRVDLFVSNGMTRNFNDSDIAFNEADLIGKTQWDHFENTPPMREQNLAFRNVDGLTFADHSASWGLDHTGMSYGTAYGDLDRDGDLDLVVVNLEEPVSIYQNHETSNQTAIVDLRGKDHNRFGIGAIVRLETKEGTRHTRQMMPTTGFASSNIPELHFGLGDHTQIAKLEVIWPSGTVQTFANLATNQRFTIHEAPHTEAKRSNESLPPLYRPSKALAGLVHREKPFEDFDKQLLLPNKLSQLGPGLAWGDVDHDGDDDLYVSAARGMGGAVLLNEGPDAQGVCQFSLAPTEAFLRDAQQENMGALFFDADNDGDRDLYVANGSYEYDENDPLLQDRLYLNDGKGRFQAAANALPQMHDASSTVVGADFDRDGDVDLFVGGRVVPGKYPEPARSHLLLNDSQAGRARFTQAPETQAPGLQDIGLVTGALWSDADDDGWLDLFITCEWGPISYYHNNQGTLENRTESAGLAEILGWWNGISGADIDHDGDMDYAVTNFGLNTKYHASTKKPALLYYGDHTGTGKKTLVEAKISSDGLLPIRGKSCSTHAMPTLGNRFETFRQFASATLTEIYEPARLDEALQVQANTLESGYLLNDGTGQFTFLPFPRLAQASPSFGSAFVDANADGHLDLILAQNFYQPQFETGPYASGLGLLLVGDGQGGFEPCFPDTSGLLIPGDATAATYTDLNRDGRWDLIIAQNDGPLLTFENTAPHGNRLRIDLDGPEAGARVTVSLASGAQRVHEVHLGSGYLSQSSSTPVLSLGSEIARTVTVRWPNGKESEPIPVAEGQEGVAVVSR